MVTEIVRQAIQLKMRSRAESPLISEAEYCCACGLGLRLLGDPKGLLSKVKAMDTVHEVKETVVPLCLQKSVKQKKSRRRNGFFTCWPTAG